MTNKTTFLLLLFGLLFPALALCQSPPWNNPLRMAWSTDGTTFDTPVIFQDSAGVPSVVRWRGDTLIAAFQWFRQPNPSASWDRVATKFSYDNGLSWTEPTPIVVNGLPANYQRPFDPTLAVVNGDSIRIYFSSSNGTPQGGLDSTVNTYSAISIDGINFYFEPNARVDELSNRLIDPAVIYFNSSWHYLSPIGAPQQGAYHYVSPDGLNFTAVPNIPSDNMHNWTGNYMVDSSNALRFYGSGQNIWYNASTNGGVWSGYVNTNIQGGDPSVLKVAPNSYLMIFVGQPYPTGVDDILPEEKSISLYPNPAKDFLYAKLPQRAIGANYAIYDRLGKLLQTGLIESETPRIALTSLPQGVYFFVVDGDMRRAGIFLKE